jgi:crotonobetainyl-CoA:carnitine CoA-transferase CaiB-like acyl-CoA transferase
MADSDNGKRAVPADLLPLKAGAALDLLEGITVLDLTTSVAGPYAGQLLGDMGADVIKVERPGSGDDCRAWGPPFLDGESLWFLAVNRNKRSLTLDYAADGGREVLYDLVTRADVVLVNLVGRVQRKLGIDHERLKAINPALIHVTISGFGLEGARADMPCYDLIAEGYSGVMDMTGELENLPQKVGTPAADLLAGHDAAMAAIAALFRRERKGGGCAIDISMIESMTRFMAPRISPFLGSGDLMRRSGARDSVIAIYQAFETADEPLTLALGNDAIWTRFWAAVGEPEFAERPEYASNVDRRSHRAVLVERIAAILLTRKRDEWLDLFQQARIPSGPMARLDEVAADAELQARGFLYSVERGGVKVPQIGLGIGFDGASEGPGLAPKLGQHSDAILADWLGYGESRIAELRAGGIV